MKPFSVLFVEDDRLTLQAYEDRAESYGWIYQTARSIEHAESLLRQGGDLDAIVLDDYVGPGRGFHLLPTIQEHHPQAYVVSASSVPTSPDHYPGISYVEKPMVCRHLLHQRTLRDVG